MTNATDLKIGQCYFFVGFYDRQLRYPHIRTMFHLGRNIFDEKSTSDKWYFQEAETYLSKRIPRTESEAEDLGVLAIGIDGLPLIETLDSLIEKLNDVKHDKLRYKHKPL